MAAPPRAPVRQTEIVYPTPLIEDVLFSELVDTTRNAVPAYGTPHPNTVKWPHHELVFAKEADAEDSGRDGMFEFFYAAKRENQDDYNFSFTKADIGGTKFDAVARTYVTLRSAFTPNTPAMGATMPDVPASFFTGTYVLAEKRQTRVDVQELDALYVAETHVYVKRATLTDNGFNEALGVNLSRTTTLYYRGETVSGVAIETLVADDKNAYWGTQVSLKISRSGEQLSDNWFAVTEQQITLKRGNDGALTDNWPIGQVKIKGAGNLTPQKFWKGVEVVETATLTDLDAGDVDDIPSPNPLTGDQVEVRVTKINDYRYQEKVTTEAIDLSADPLKGSKTFGNYGGGIGTSEEKLEPDGAIADAGFLVLSSSVDPLGNGKSIRSTLKADEDFPPLSGSDYNQELDLVLPYTQQVRQAGTPSSELQEVTPIDKWRSLVKDFNREPIKDKLKGIHHIFPTQDSVALPNTLKSVKVLASRTLANGDGLSGGSSGSTSISSSVSVSADLSLEIEEGYNGVVDAEVHVFFLESEEVTKSAIEVKVNATSWPTFRPISTRLVLAGNGITKQKDLSQSKDGWSYSESSSVNAFTNVAVIPACLCSGVDVTIEYRDYVAPTAILDVIRDKAAEAWEKKIELIQQAKDSGIPVFGVDTSTTAGAELAQTYIDAYSNEIAFETDLELEAFPIEVIPSFIAATTPALIEAGRYIKTSNVSLYGYGMVKVTVVVVTLT